MNTRFTPLVTLKKSTMEKSQQSVQKASKDLQSATEALKLSYDTLNDIALPQSGSIASMLASRELQHLQRETIVHNQKWVEYASSQLDLAKQQLKTDMIEHEKFKYLELEEMRKILKQRKIQEAKELDEVALMTFEKKG